MSDKFSIAGAINKVVNEREEKNQSSWHASSLGQCLTGEYLVRKGLAKKTFDDRTKRVFAMGKLVEDWVIQCIAKSGVDYTEQVRIEWPEYDLTGYADLVIGDTVFEIKSKNSRSFTYMVDQEEGASRHNMQQLWVYLKVLNKPEGRILYVSKDDLRLVEYNVYRNDVALEGEVVAQLTLLNTAWNSSLPPEPVRDKKDWRYKYCSVHQQCLNQPNYL